MDYDEFRAEYDPVFDVLDAETLPGWLPGAIARLKQLAATIDDPADRRSAENDIAMIESVLSAGADEQTYSAAMIEAERVHALANADDGTDEERIARAEAGMAEI